jgi:hypothetical protein
MTNRPLIWANRHDAGRALDAALRVGRRPGTHAREIGAGASVVCACEAAAGQGRGEGVCSSRQEGENGWEESCEIHCRYC